MKKYDMNDHNNEKFLWSKKINYIGLLMFLR